MVLTHCKKVSNHFLIMKIEQLILNPVLMTILF